MLTSKRYATVRDPSSLLDGHRVVICSKDLDNVTYKVFDTVAGFPKPIHIFDRHALVDFEYQCAKCGVVKTGMKMCSACRRDHYCCRECQKQDWSAHKKRHHTKK